MTFVRSLVVMLAAWLLSVGLATRASAQENGVLGRAAQDPQESDVSQKAYTPRPGETVVKWTFKTTEGVMRERGTGDVYMVFHFENAPETCAHILDLVKKGYYDGIKVHRVETRADFALVQWGNAATKDPNWDGKTEASSGTTVKRELSEKKHIMGAVGLARRTDPDSGDAQMYVCLISLPRLDEKYAVWAQVVAGFDILKYVKVGSEIVSAVVVQEGPDVPPPKRDEVVAFVDPEGKLVWVTTPSGLQYADAVVGEGDPVTSGQTVVVHYTGWLRDKTKFDSSKDKGEPLRFEVGSGAVIKGWDEGVVGMKVGGTRKLIIPPRLGYGPAGFGDVIPPDSTLIFEVELLGIE
jgi:cyclophilin family peptidyl-prolyl cis-trans isomerase